MAEAAKALPEWLQLDTPHGKWVILACYIWSKRDQVVSVIEWETKPWKKRGQESIPFETVERGETDEQAVRRAVKEELELPEEALEFMEEKWKLFLDVNRTRDHVIFEAKVFLVQLRTGTVISNVVGGTELIWRWLKHINSFNGNARPATKLALKIATWSYDKANPMPFVTIEDGEETGEY